MPRPDLNVLAPEVLERIAYEELGEDPKRRSEDIKAIQDWIKKQPHLHKSIRTDDNFILVFLRGCKFSLERTKEKLDTFYSVKTAVPEWFDNWDIDDKTFRELISSGYIIPLKGYDKEGRRVMILKPGAFDPDKHDLDVQLKVNMMISLMSFCHNDQGSITGMIGIQDLSGINFAHAALFTPALGKKAMTVWQDAFPQRPKGMHFLNTPSLMEKIISIMMGFAKEKMKKRIFVYGKDDDFSRIHEVVGKEILPVEYGGTNGTLQEHIDDLIKEIEAKRDWFKEECKYKSNEKKRPNKARTYSDIFGMEGSFRQLAFD